MNSSNLLARNARKYPMSEAVVSLGKRTSFGELDLLVNKFSNALLNQGLQKGDRIVLFIPNVLDFVISYFAVQRIGAIVVPINAKFSLREVEFVMTHSEARCIITHDMLFPNVSSLHLGEIKIKTGSAANSWLSMEELLEKAGDTVIPCHLSEDDLSTILYTSGTTGDPKGVLFSYRNILTVANMIAVEMEVKPESRMLLMMPLSHSAPLHLFLMAAFIVGCTSVLTPTFTPDLLIESVINERTTHFFGAPVAYLVTAQNPRLIEADLSSMKWWVYGGAPLSKNEVLMIAEKFKTDRLVSVYGLTEAGPSGSLLLADEHPHKAGSIGRRAPLGTELRIVDEEGRDVLNGEVGEIVLYGEGNMQGYYKNEKATSAAFIDGWLRTGDLARMDEEGYLWIVDRKKDVIISGGITIYPKEIEEMLLQFNGIAEAAVIGIPHPEWGETIKAVFSGHSNIDIEKLKGYLSKNLASYKVPRIFEQLNSLPRNASGKILKQQLKGDVLNESIS
ncbi:class I adenylate-forming enzyme family protein [Lysinibacillus sp. 3P01SB]|uniref:class I adenylate-forming enzyme family protein n=1 Tax=Lysinibacillus sp. 3P01SB TaxID=3132284 RepID=UPI0039A46DF9